MTTPAALVRPLALLAVIPAVITAVITATVMVDAGTAQAAPTGCSVSANYAGASSTCTAGTGEQRVAGQACSAIWGCTVTQNFFGPWVGPSGTSTLTLNPAWFFPGNGSGAWIETRG